MSRRGRPGRAPTMRGGICRGQQSQPPGWETSTRPSIVAVSSPSRSVTDLRGPRGASPSSSRARASILQSARQVGIHGGNFNTAGTQQLNVTFNLVGEQGSEQTQGPGRQRRDERAYNDNPEPWPSNPPVQRSCDIYYRLIAVKGRGSPLWIPGPNQSLHINYQRQGMEIGDVGIINASGSFDFLFNICLPRDHPINPPELPENFMPLPLSPLDIQQHSEFLGESYLSSASVKKSRKGDLRGLTFESSASEGAILTMPVGSNSADIGNIARFRRYLAANAEYWYRYILDIRGREPQNGDVLLVTGWDKTKSWGMATFSNTTAEQEPFLLQFRPIEQGNTGMAYGWEYSGFAEVRAGPGERENERLRMGDPSQAGMEYENQCLFIRTLNVTLQDDIWKKLALEFGLADADGTTNTTNTTESRPSRDGSTGTRGPSSGAPQYPASTSGPGGHMAPSTKGHEAEDVAKSRQTKTAQFSPRQAALAGHPSKGINKLLLKVKPGARMAITEDWAWISVLKEDDTILPPIEQLYERMMATSALCVEEDTVFLQPKEAHLTVAPSEMSLKTFRPNFEWETSDEKDDGLMESILDQIHSPNFSNTSSNLHLNERPFHRTRSDTQKSTNTIDEMAHLQRNETKKSRTIKILLLGQSASGKSTVRKQFQMLLSPIKSGRQRMKYRPVVYLNLVIFVRRILEIISPQSNALPVESHAAYQRKLAPLAGLEKHLTHLISSLDEEETIHPLPLEANWKTIYTQSSSTDGNLVWWEDPDDPVHTLNACAPAMQELWEDQQVRKYLQEKKMLRKIKESDGFFLDEIPRIAAKKYIPTDADVLKSWSRTQGVVERNFSVSTEGIEWRIYDFGGERSLRQAWTPYFEDASAIIFLAPVSEFDQYLREDRSANRLEDSLLLWKSIVSNKLLAHVTIFLFLNKCDLLKAKLDTGIRLNEYLISYGDRPNDFHHISKYFRNKFGVIHQAYTPNKDRMLYIHRTTATDIQTLRVTISSVLDVIINENVQNTRLV